VGSDTALQALPLGHAVEEVQIVKAKAFDQGEERLIEGVQRGTIPLTTALEIARANENASTMGEDGQANLGDLLQEAYENGLLVLLLLQQEKTEAFYS
jgi:hypothetical protein